MRELDFELNPPVNTQKHTPSDEREKLTARVPCAGDAPWVARPSGRERSQRTLLPPQILGNLTSNREAFFIIVFGESQWNVRQYTTN